MSKKDENVAPKNHNDLYWAVRKLWLIVNRERAAHPRTKVWKDLEEITRTIDDIQKVWFRNG